MHVGGQIRVGNSGGNLDAEGGDHVTNGEDTVQRRRVVGRVERPPSGTAPSRVCEHAVKLGEVHAEPIPEDNRRLWKRRQVMPGETRGRLVELDRRDRQFST